MKKSVKSIVNILIIFITIVAILSMYAYSKYIDKLTGNGVSTVAKWSFKVNGESSETQSFNLAETINKTANTQEGVIAPGTNGYYDIEIDTRKTEVAVKYEIKMQIENKPQNLHFYTDENYAKILNEDGENIVLTGFIPLEEVDGVRNVRIYWNWPYKTGNTEQEVMENNLKDTEDAGKTMTANVTVTGTQAKPESKEVNYTVKYYVENANYEGYTLYQTQTKTGMSETQITLSSIAEDIENAVYSHGSEVENGERVSNVEIKGDGTTNIYLYYARSRYTLKVKAGEEIKGVKAKGTSTAVNEEEEKEIKEVKFKYGEHIELSAILKETEGYTPTFKEWQVESEIVNSDQSTANGETNSEESTTNGATNSDPSITNESTTETINLGENYNPNSQTTTITMPKQDIIITAVGAKIANKYTVIFDKNTGEGTMANQSFVYEQEKALSRATFTKVGYTFASWNTQADGKGETYTDEQTVKNLTAEANGIVTLYAIYTPNKYTVTFNNNGGIGEMKPQTLEYDKIEQLTENTFTKPGYTFTGWNLNEEGTDTNYQNQEEVVNLTAEEDGNVTMYAQWSANSYTVEFNANSGNGTMTNQILTYDIAKELKPNTFTKQGYTFEGWNTQQNGKGEKYSDKEQVTNLVTEVNGKITLYAQWKANEYTVIYDANTGTGEMANQVCIYNVTTNLKENQYTKEGYEFSGWNTSKEGTGESYTNKNEIINLTDSANGIIILYAQWTANKYKIEFNSNTGTGEMEVQEYTYDVAQSLNENKFIKQGYTFANWATTADGKGEKYNDKQEIKNLTALNNKTITLYAIWTPNTNTKYTIKHNVMNTEGTYEVVETENMKGTTNSSLKLKELVKTTTAYNVPNGIYYSKIEVNGKIEDTNGIIVGTENQTLAGAITNTNEAIAKIAEDKVATILPDGSLEINIYYARAYGYLTTMAGVNVSKVTSQSNEKYYYGKTIQELTAILKMEQGYLTNFEKWESSQNNYLADILSNPAKEITWPSMPEGTKITLTAKATKVESDQTPYTVNYYLENANNEEYTLNKQATLAGKTNEKITEEMVQTEIANATLERTDLEEDTEIKADGSTVVNVYYKRNRYELSLIKGENIKEVLISTGSVENVDNTKENTENDTLTQNIKYGANVNITATTENNEGYTYEFTGWTTTSTNLGANYDQAQSKTQITMPAENVELTATASKTANTYTINFNANSGIGEMNSQTFTYRTAQKLIANTFTKTGYTFKGWATEVGTETVKYENEEEILNMTTTPNDQITLYAVWKDETAPELALTTETTTNTITVEVNTTETGSGLEENYKYYIGKKEETSKTAETTEKLDKSETLEVDTNSNETEKLNATKENTNIIYSEPITKSSTTHTFEELEDNTEYYIKVEIADKAGNIGQTIQTATTQELIGAVTFTNEYWTNGKYVLTVNTEAVDKTQTPYKIQYKIVSAEEQFDPSADWEESGTEENTTENTINNTNSQNSTATQDEATTQETDTTQEGTTTQERNATETASPKYGVVETGTILTGIEDGETVYARLYDGTNGTNTYNTCSVVNTAKKTYTEEELIKIPYKATAYEILTYETTGNSYKVDISKEIAGTETYNYYAKDIDEEEYKLVSTCTNWDDPAIIKELESNKTYKVKVLATDNSGNVTKCTNTAVIITLDSVKEETTYAENRTYIDPANHTATIPAGFSVSGEETENNIANGMVLKDTQGNEFVWIPVENTIYDEKTTVPTSSGSTLTYKPMVRKQAGSTNSYEAMYYTYSGTKSWTNTSNTYRLGSNNYIEPSLITGVTQDGNTWNVTNPAGTTYDAEESNYNGILGFNTVEDFGKYLNESYTSMVESVDKYNGFYCGRYETTNNNGEAGSKKNESLLNIKNWYELYKIQDSNRNSNNTYYNTASVISQMITQSQYDAVLNFILTGPNKSTVTNGTVGNKTNQITTSGSYSNDKKSNIYDLTSNAYEYTIGSYQVAYRQTRGGSYDLSDTSNSSTRRGTNPKELGPILGSRMTLYISSTSDMQAPTVEIEKIEPTLNTIKVTVKAQDKGSGVKNYYYSISEDGQNWSEEIKTTAPNYTFTGLESTTTYYIKVKAEDRQSNISSWVEQTTQTGGIILHEEDVYLENTYGADGAGVAMLGMNEEYENEGYYTEYQVVKQSETFDQTATWTKGDVIIELSETDTLYVRLTDGITIVKGYKIIDLSDKFEHYSQVYTKTQEYTDANGETATIPAGFKVGTSSTVNTIENGLVIEDESGNQYVWVPVENAVYDETTAIGYSKGYTPMAMRQEENSEYYEGIYYTFTNTDSTANLNYRVGTDQYREPSLITYSANDGYTWNVENKTLEGANSDASEIYYKNILKFNTVEEYGKYMNEEYTNMVNSVKKYKGFYIARAETSVTGTKVQSQIAKTPYTGVDWYKKYYYQDSNRYENNPYYNSTSVVSSMMWNSQYNAMLNWMLKGKDANKISDITIGNHGTQSNLTGTSKDDIINNVIDLSGNLIERTQGRHGSTNIIYRGGNYNYSTTWHGNRSAKDITGQGYVLNGDKCFGTRMSLYIVDEEDIIAPELEILDDETEITTNSIKIKVSVKEEGSGVDKYNYYISTDGINYTKNVGYGNTYKFEGLTQNQTYYIKVTVTDKAGNESNTVNITKTTNILNMQEGDIQLEAIYGKNGSGVAYFVPSKELQAQGYTLEYQKNNLDVNGTWTKSQQVNNLSVGDVIYVRATDGTNLAENSYIYTHTVEELETYSEIYTETRPYTDANGKTATIPAGFKVGTSSINKTIDGGLVIEDENENQYVWVPVKNVLYDSAEGTIPNNFDNASKNSQSYKPMVKYQKGYSKTTSEQYFEGILYNNWGKSCLYGSYAQRGATDYALGQYNCREPSLVTGSIINYSWIYKAGKEYDADSKNYKDILGFNSAEEFGNYINEEYTNMVKSVEKYGGFYIGRYETSIANEVVSSKINQTPMVSITWYKMMYNQDSKINELNPYSQSNSVVSAMITGSQWDATLNWVLEGKYEEKVYTVTGNHTGRRLKTGETGSDYMNNIIDMSSNVREWTQEAAHGSNRTYRGDAYAANSNGGTWARNTTISVNNWSSLGSRLTLYIK